MKKVLLTGATGLIGKYAIQPLIDNGFEVFAISSAEKGNSKDNVNWIKADLLNSSDIRLLFEQIKPEYLLHFAWDTTPKVYLESNLNFDWLEASLEMLKQFKLNGGKRAVFAGTCFEYKFKDEPLKEDGELNPTSTYAKCKNHLNQLSTIYSEKNDISFGWGRIFYVYGENENPQRLVPVLINNLKNNKEVTITTGELIKDYMFAQDIASGFVKFLDSEVRGNVNICTNIPIKVKEIANIIAKRLNKEHLVKFKNQDNNEPKIILGDNTRLSQEVKFTPKYPLEAGLDIIMREGND